MTQNSTTTTDTFIEQNTTKYLKNINDAKVFDTPQAIANHNLQNDGFDSDLDSDESMQDLAGMLFCLEDAEQLFLLGQVPEFSRRRLNRFCRLLPPQQQQLIRQWAIENQGRHSCID